MLRLPKGTFLCFGPDRGCEVHTLTEHGIKLFYDRTMLADLPKAVEATFGRGFQAAIPVVEEACRALAEGYEGCRRAEVRGICAAIVLGIPFEDLQQGRIPGVKPRKAQKPADTKLVAV